MTFDLEKAKKRLLEPGEDDLRDRVATCFDVATGALAEVERLRSRPRDIYEIKCECGNAITIDNGHLYSRIAAKDARIKALEGMIKQLGSLAFMGNKPLDQIIAHFVAWGQSNHEYTERLEAAFLDAYVDSVLSRYEGEGDQEYRQSYADKKARAALEELRK